MANRSSFAINLANKDPEVGVWRNGTMIMNWAHFCSGPENLERQAKAREMLQEIYNAPVDSQTAVTQVMMEDVEEALVPYLFYDAIKTGHVEITETIKKSNKLALNGGPDRYDDAVASYEKRRRREVFEALADEKAAALASWLDEFSGQGAQLIFHAAVAGDEDTVHRLLDWGVDPQSSEVEWCDPLHAACFNGHLECAKLLVSSGMDVNLRAEGGGTPLMRAAVGGRTEIVRWLLQRGAEGGVREERGLQCNALDYGAGRGDVGLVRLLLPSCGFSPVALAGAAKFGKEESFALILDAGEFPKVSAGGSSSVFWETQISEEQRSAIVMAIEQGGSGKSTRIIDQLLAYVPLQDLNSHEEIRMALQNSLMRAVNSNAPSIVSRLAKILTAQPGSKENIRNDINAHFVQAAAFNAVDVLKILREEFEADVNWLDPENGTSALHLAARNGSVKATRYLVDECQADTHSGSGKFANGPTALWIAVYEQHEEIVRDLLARGGPVEWTDPKIEQGKTKTIYVSTARISTYRAPVKLHAESDPAWDDRHEAEGTRFLCLEYPDEGWPGGVQMRRSDDDLRDEREIMPKEQDGFVMV